jgi:hypothetical protein
MLILIFACCTHVPTNYEGVWPESQSFQDDGLGVPKGWRGVCDNGSDPTFQCNK